MQIGVVCLYQSGQLYYGFIFFFIPFFIFFVETFAYHRDDAFRYAFLPFTFALAIAFGIYKGFLTSPLSYADVFGSLWCFLSVALVSYIFKV
jgi:hypothetical protein